MQMIGSITFFVAGVAAVTAFSVSLYAALPKAVLAYAERHGRFQGLPGRDRFRSGTRAGQPPEARLGTVAQGIAARGYAPLT
jgi:hypothetical protein